MIAAERFFAAARNSRLRRLGDKESCLRLEVARWRVRRQLASHTGVAGKRDVS
jgi:hypothetical protein